MTACTLVYKKKGREGRAVFLPWMTVIEGTMVKQAQGIWELLKCIPPQETKKGCFTLSSSAECLLKKKLLGQKKSQKGFVTDLIITGARFHVSHDPTRYHSWSVGMDGCLRFQAEAVARRTQTPVTRSVKSHERAEGPGAAVNIALTLHAARLQNHHFIDFTLLFTPRMHVFKWIGSKILKQLKAALRIREQNSGPFLLLLDQKGRNKANQWLQSTHWMMRHRAKC